MPKCDCGHNLSSHDHRGRGECNAALNENSYLGCACKFYVNSETGETIPPNPSILGLLREAVISYLRHQIKEWKDQHKPL